MPDKWIVIIKQYSVRELHVPPLVGESSSRHPIWRGLLSLCRESYEALTAANEGMTVSPVASRQWPPTKHFEVPYQNRLCIVELSRNLRLVATFQKTPIRAVLDFTS